MSQRFYIHSTAPALTTTQGSGPNQITVSPGPGQNFIRSFSTSSGGGVGPYLLDWTEDQNYSFSVDIVSSGADITTYVNVYREYAVGGSVTALPQQAFTGSGIKTWSGLPYTEINDSPNRSVDDHLYYGFMASNASTMSTQSLVFNADDPDSWIEVPFDPGPPMGQATLSGDVSVTVSVRGKVDPTNGNGGSIFVIPLSNRYYAAIWEVWYLDNVQQDDGTRGIRLLRSTPEEDGFEWAGTAQIWSRNNGVAHPHGAVRLSNTQLIYWHTNYTGLGNTRRLYIGGAALNENGDSSTLSNSGFGSYVLQPSSTSGGGGGGSHHLDRLTDKKFLLAYYMAVTATPTWSVRLLAGYVSGTDGYSPVVGSAVDLGDLSSPSLTVVGLSDTRAAILAVQSDRTLVGKMVSIASGDTGTTITDLSGSWATFGTDAIGDLPWGKPIAKKLDSTRFLLYHPERDTSASTDRRVVVRVVDTTGDTFTLGDPLVLVSRDAGQVPQISDFVIDDVIIQDPTQVFIAASREGSSQTSFGTAATSTAVGTNTMTINKPASTVNGEALYAFFAIDGDDGTVTITPPSGWTRIGVERNSGNVGLHAYQRISASDGANFQWGFSSNVTAVGAILRYPTSVLDDPPIIPLITSQTGSGTNPVVPFNYATVSLAVSATGSDVAHSPPSGYSEHVDLGAGGTVRLSIASDVNTGFNGHSTSFTAASSQWATMHIRPPAVDGPTMGWVVDCGTSGTTATLDAELGVLDPPYGRYSGSLHYESSQPALIDSAKGVRGLGMTTALDGPPTSTSWGVEFFNYMPINVEQTLMHTHLNAGVLLG